MVECGIVSAIRSCTAWNSDEPDNTCSHPHPPEIHPNASTMPLQCVQTRRSSGSIPLPAHSSGYVAGAPMSVVLGKYRRQGGAHPNQAVAVGLALALALVQAHVR